MAAKGEKSIMSRRTSGDETWHRLLLWIKGQKSSERLSAHILAADGYKAINPSDPLGGPDGIKDFIMRKNNITWIGAAFFPNGQQDFKKIKVKFTSDLAGVKRNNVRGLSFITNQELSIGERQALNKIAKPITVDIYHLERISSILDRPENYGIRLEYLDIELSKEEQLSFFSTSTNRFDAINRKLDSVLQNYDNFIKASKPKKATLFIKRKRKEVESALEEFFDKVWYDRHQLLKNQVKEKKTKVSPEIWKGARQAAKRVEGKYGLKNLSPYSDFDWGMINGKLSALRWILGDEWDMLDT